MPASLLLGVLGCVWPALQAVPADRLESMCTTLVPPLPEPPTTSCQEAFLPAAQEMGHPPSPARLAHASGERVGGCCRSRMLIWGALCRVAHALPQEPHVAEALAWHAEPATGHAMPLRPPPVQAPLLLPPWQPCWRSLLRAARRCSEGTSVMTHSATSVSTASGGGLHRG